MKFSLLINMKMPSALSYISHKLSEHKLPSCHILSVYKVLSFATQPGIWHISGSAMDCLIDVVVGCLPELVSS